MSNSSSGRRMHISLCNADSHVGLCGHEAVHAAHRNPAMFMSAPA